MTFNFATLVQPLATIILGVLSAWLTIISTRRSGRHEREAAMERVARELIIAHQMKCPLGDAMAVAVADRKREVGEQISGVRVEMRTLINQERQERNTLHSDMRDLRADVRSIREMLVEVAAGVKKMNGNQHA